MTDHIETAAGSAGAATIGARIAAGRQAKGFSQEYVAEQLGVSRQAVSKWETDQSAPDTHNLIALAGLLGLTVEYIATGALPPEPPAPAPAPPTPPPQTAASTQRGVGFLLFGTGLIGILLFILVSPALALISALVAVTGVLLLSIKRHLGLVLSWTYSILAYIVLRTMIGMNPLYVYTFYTRGIVGILIGIGEWALFLLASFFTVRTILHARRNKKKSQ